MTANVGFAALQIIPSMEGIEGSLGKSLGGLGSLGKKAGQAVGQGMADGVEAAAKRVEAATDKVTKANDKSADSAGKLRTAEAQLQSLRDKGVTDTGRLVAAEEKVAKAKRDNEQSSREVERAARDLTRAEKAAADAADDAAAKVENVGKKSIFTADNLMKAGAVAATAFVGVGKILYDIGGQFDDVTDTIRAKTGATGAELDGLVDISKKLGTQVPVEFAKIGETVGQLATRVKATGPDLQALAQQFLEMGQLGQELDIDRITQALNGFGVTGKDATAAMDELFRVSQATGVPMNDLADAAVKGGPALRQFGFDMAQSAGLAGLLDKAGLDSSKMMMGLTKELAVFAKAGKEPQKAFRDTITQLDAMVKAGNSPEATNLANKIFGARSGAGFIDALKQGKLDVEDFVKATGSGSDTINTAAADTYDFAEQWQLFKNKAMVELEPIASRVFGLIGSFMETITERGIPTLKSLGEWVGRNKENLQTFGMVAGVVAISLGALALQQKIVAAGGMLSFLKNMIVSTKLWTIAQGAFNVVMSANPISLIVIGIAALVAGIVIAYKRSETFRNIVQGAFNGIKVAAQFLWNNVLKPVFELWVGYYKTIGNAALWLWKNAIVPVFNGIKWVISTWWGGVKITFGFFTDAIGNIGDKAGQVKDWVVEKFTAITGFITSLPSKIADGAKGMWDGIKNSFQTMINFLIRGWNFFAEKLSFTVPDIPGVPRRGEKVQPIPSIPPVQFDGGGWTGPGGKYQPAGLVHADEFVIRKESRQRLEANHPGALDSMNRDGVLPGYADGGRVGYGLSTGSNSGGYGGGGVTFPAWVDQVAREFGVKPSTYPGHQESDRNEAGYEANPQHLNRGIDWAGPLEAMQRFAEHLLKIAPTTRAIEQIIWQNPTTSQRIGWAGRSPDTRGSYFANDYAGHRDHVHTRQNDAFTVTSSPTDGVGTGGNLASNPVNLGGGSGTYDYSQGTKDERKTKFEEDNAAAKKKYDEDLAALKAKYRIGTTNTDMQEASRDISRRRIELNQAKRAEEQAAGGDKDQLKAIRDKYKPQLDQLKTESESLSLQKLEVGSASQADKEAFKQAKEELDRKFEEDKKARKAAFDKAKDDKAKDESAQKSYPTSLSGWAALGASTLVEGQAKSLLGVFGINDSPAFLGAAADAANQVRVTDKNGKHLFGGYEGSGGSGATPGGQPIPGGNAPGGPPVDGKGREKDYPFQIARAAKDRKLTDRAAVIAAATALVESGDPMKMYANKSVPDSLKLPHDAVGSDHDSVGLFQQRQQGWGTLADRMDPYRSAGMFLAALVKLPNWESMDMGQAAQAVQRSAFPDRYGQKIARAEELVKGTGVFDAGGIADGIGEMRKRVIKPERVLSPRQTDAFETMVAHDFQSGNAGVIAKLEEIRHGLGKQGATYNLHGENTETQLRKAQHYEKRNMAAKMAGI